MELVLENAVKESITISTQSIMNELKAYEDKPEDSIIEYIWNGFDANATRVDINYEFARSIDGTSFSLPNVEVKDNGYGWDLSDTSTIKVFLESHKKKIKKLYKSMPHGSKGVGRFTFFSFASSATWLTTFEGTQYKLELEKTDLNNYALAKESTTSSAGIVGTSVSFEVTSNKLHEGFFINTLKNRILAKMAWFLVLYPDKEIYINDEKIDPYELVDEVMDATVIVDEISLPVKMIRWKEPLADKENSKLYYIDSNSQEVFKRPTGLNNKADIFYHSAYVTSEKFDNFIPTNDEVDTLDAPAQERLIDGEQSRFINTTKDKVYEKLVEFRQPHIEKSSDRFIEDWRKDEQYPDVTKYSVDADQYHDLIRQTFITAPSLYLGVSVEQRKIILNLLASLLGSDDKDLILTVLNQVYELDETEKKSLKEILERTTLKNVISLTKEVDKRLQTIEDLDLLLHDPNLFRNTLEVEHLQKLINQSFWIFGDEYHLVMDTEGSIKTAINKWAQDILEIEGFETQVKSRKELDLLLSKKLEYGKGRVLNIVVELKRPSVKLTDKEYTQIYNYRNQLLSERACKGENIEWIFILIGTDYDESISRRIESQATWGEKDRGLTENVPSERTRIYVRKWSDVINSELRPRYRHLSDKLQLQMRDRKDMTSSQIVDEIEVGITGEE